MAKSPSPPRQPESVTDKVFRYGNEVVYICLVSALWLICSLPLVTVGAATTAAYACLLAHLRDGSREYVRPFWTGFRASLGRAMVLPLMLTALIGLFGLNTYYYLLRGDALGMVLGVVQGLLGVICCVLTTYYSALAGRFRQQELSGPPPTLRDAARELFAAPGWSGLIGLVCMVVPAALVVTRLWQFAIFAPGLICYGNSQVLVRLDRRS